MSRLLIRNGRVVDPSQRLDQGMDILIDDGAHRRLGERIEVPARCRELDAAGLVVAPGFIDLHAHLREPGLRAAGDDRDRLPRPPSRAASPPSAACPTPSPVNDDPAVTEFIRERAAAAGLARVYPVGAVSKGLAGEELAEIGEMVRAGAVAFSDDGRPVRSAHLMRRALEYARSFDVPVAAHAEDPDLSDGGRHARGRGVDPPRPARASPAAAEEVMVARDLILAELHRRPAPHRHLSTARQPRAGARRQGARASTVTCEVTPHHLTLTDEAVADREFDTATEDQPAAALRGPRRGRRSQALYDGTVDAIATDHAPHHADEKELEFADAPFGMVGLETAVSLAIDRLVHARGDRPDAAGRACCRPGRRRSSGCRAARCKVGGPADVTLLDLRRRRHRRPGALPVEVAEHAVRRHAAQGRPGRDHRRRPDRVEGEVGAGDAPLAARTAVADSWTPRHCELSRNRASASQTARSNGPQLRDRHCLVS